MSEGSPHWSNLLRSTVGCVHTHTLVPAPLSDQPFRSPLLNRSPGSSPDRTPSPTKPCNYSRSRMKLFACTLVLALASLASAESYEDGDERLGYISVGNSGATSITFNATSIQNAVILGLFILVLGALILPLFGISLASLFGSSSGDTGYGYGYEQSGYEAPATSSGYQSFSKR